MVHSKKLVILMADDDEDDRLLVEGALEGQPAKLLCVENGIELLDYLYCHGKYCDMEKYPRPDLVLLDLNMPMMGGRQALQKIKADPELTSIPVIMLTTSKEQCDVARCYELGANTYIIKPMSFEGLVQTFKAFHVYWDDTSTLPPPSLPKSCLEKHALC